MDSQVEIVDTHVHLQRDADSEALMYPKAGWPRSWFWFHPPRVVEYMRFWNISYIVAATLMNVRRIPYEFARARGLPLTAGAGGRPSPGQLRGLVDGLNEWALDVSARHPRILTFLAVEPNVHGNELLAAVAEGLERGARGIKVHPRNGDHLPTHPSLMPVYELCQSKQVPVLTDTGGAFANGRPPLTHPDHWKPVLRAFPDLRVIMAHLGGELWQDRLQVAREFRRESLMFDLAGGLVDSHHPAGNHRQLAAEDAPRVFREIGVERILFGSDAPHGDPMDTARQVAGLRMSDAEKERIFSLNARALLQLDVTV